MTKQVTQNMQNCPYTFQCLYGQINLSISSHYRAYVGSSDARRLHYCI